MMKRDNKQTENEMKYYNDWTNEEVDIATLEQHEDGECVRVANMEDLALLVQCFGYTGLEEFTQLTGVKANEVLSKFFCVLKNSVSFAA